MAIDTDKLDEIIVSAQNGSAEDQYLLGFFYSAGRWVNRDYSKSLEWYQKAAEQGHLRAQFSLGVMYYQGKGTKKDYGKAKLWLDKTAESGNNDAKRILKKINVILDKIKAEEEKNKEQDKISTDEVKAGVALESENSAEKKSYVSWFMAAAIVILAVLGLIMFSSNNVELRAWSGSSEAQAWLGSSYERGINGYRKDAQNAVYWYRKAAEQGHTDAQYNLGIIYSWGQGVPQNSEQGAYWVRKAADKGHHQAEDHMCYLYMVGKGVPQDYKKAFDWGIKAARAGISYSQYAVGALYYFGRGVRQDYVEAMKWYRKSAEQGNSYAQNNLGVMYEQGQGVTRNYDQALQWYKKAATQGNTIAQTNLYNLQEKMKSVTVAATEPPELPELPEPKELYDKGEQCRLSKNYSEALKYYRQAAEHNYAPAQDKIGWMYQNGWGVSRNYSEAVNWYSKASNQGNAAAQASLAYMYYKGWGVSKNLQQALYWYKKSAEQGNATAKTQTEKIQREIDNQNRSYSDSSSYYPSSFPAPAFITGDNVNIRSGPGVNYNSVNHMNTGNPVSVSRRSYEFDGEWFCVKTAEGIEGWVYGKYISFRKQVISFQEALNRTYRLPSNGKVNTEGNLNIRNVPSLRDSRVVEQLEPGTPVTAYEIFAEEERDWYRVRTNYGYEGWVSGKYIQLMGTY